MRSKEHQGQPTYKDAAVAALLLLSALGAAPNGVQAPETSTPARTHLVEVFDVLQQHWLRRATFDWQTFRRRVLEKAGPAQTVPESYDAIKLALTLLGDRHSYYITATGEPIFNPQSPSQSTHECTPAAAITPEIPVDTGYVRIRISQPAVNANDIQQAIRRADRSGLAGWIVDLRDSRGGNMWPALLGLGSILGEGTAGFFVDAHDTSTPWGYTGGRVWLGSDTIAAIAEPHALTRPNPKVAVLTDIGVVSSGEAIAIAFRGRANTRSFGTSTCGLSTAVSQFPLSSGGRLAIVTAVMADRAGKQYGARIVPDESIAEPSAVVPRALEWLRGTR